MEPPGNPGQFNNSTTDTLSTKRFPITPNGVLGVAPYLLFATSVLGGTIHKYRKKRRRKEKKNNRSRTGLSLHSKKKKQIHQTGLVRMTVN